MNKNVAKVASADQVQGRTTRTRVAFQGAPGAFSEEAAEGLLGPQVQTVPRATFESLFRALPEGAADALLAPLENSLAGSVVRVYDLLVESHLWLAGEIVLRIEHHLIGCPGARLEQIRAVESHPVALAQCERFFAAHPAWKRIAAEDTAGSVWEVLHRGDATFAAIASRRAAKIYGGEILQSNIEDDSENYTRFGLLMPEARVLQRDPRADKVTLTMRLAHRPGALYHALRPFADRGLNLMKIESRPIQGRPWEYRFFLDVGFLPGQDLEAALQELRVETQDVQVLGCYRSASVFSAGGAGTDGIVGTKADPTPTAE
jgi:prephenate dehydratase